MARKRKKKTSRAKRFIVVGVTLIVIQALILVVFGKHRPPLQIADAVEEKLNEMNDIPDARKAQMRIQLALRQYMTKHEGKPPAGLKDLVPEFMAAVPLNPDTKKAFDYSVVNGKPQLSAPASAAPASTQVILDAAIDPKNMTPDQRNLLIASLDVDPTKEGFVYDPTGKRDPFKAFNIARPVASGASELEKAPISSFKLTAVMGLGSQAIAIVEDATGKGFNVSKGTKIGLNGGEVVEILPDRLLILEVSEDFTGQKHNNQVELRLRAKTDKS